VITSKTSRTSTLERRLTITRTTATRTYSYTDTQTYRQTYGHRPTTDWPAVSQWSPLRPAGQAHWNRGWQLPLYQHHNHPEDMVRNISYCQSGKMWRNCSQSFVKILLITANIPQWQLIMNHHVVSLKVSKRYWRWSQDGPWYPGRHRHERAKQVPPFWHSSLVTHDLLLVTVLPVRPRADLLTLAWVFWGFSSLTTDSTDDPVCCCCFVSTHRPYTHTLVVTKLDYCCSVMAGVSGTLLRRLQSVLNAAVRLVFSARRSDHITPLLLELHWLKITERIQFCLCVLSYRCLHGSAPSYLAKTLHLTSDIEARRRLRSGSMSTLFVPATRRSSLGDRAFPVAAAQAWNTLPVSLRTASSFLTFRPQLKTFLFNISFPDNWTLLDIVKWHCSFSIVTL